jgi:hypothetical protein
MSVPEGYPTLFLSASHRTFLAALDEADPEKDNLTSVAETISYGKKTIDRLLAPLLTVGAIEEAENTLGYAVTDVGRALV